MFKRSTIIAATASLLLAAPPLAAECVSATLADQVYYSCSGVLTAMPNEDVKQDTDSASDGATGSQEAKRPTPKPVPEVPKPGSTTDTP